MQHDKFAFISDFDGTITERDFYKIVIDKYLPEMGKEPLTAWLNKEYTDRDFLNMVFSNINISEEQLLQEILQIPMDTTAFDVIKAIQDAGGTFVILSAGTSYYIQPLLEHYGLKNVIVYSNLGEYKDGGIHLVTDEKAPFYSDFYGINKEKVVKFLKKQFPAIYYAGDSAPDINPCKHADIAFAKGALQGMLDRQHIDYVPITKYQEIYDVLKEKGVL